MYIVKKLPRHNVAATIIVPRTTKERLKDTCFRTTDQPLAGNFSHWRTVEEVLGNPKVLKDFLERLDGILDSEVVGGMHSQCIVMSREQNVGWESTDDIEGYDLDLLERFNLNRRATALRVKLDRRDVKAPKTHLLTLVFSVREESRGIVVMVHSMYPGCNVGKLEGDVTAWEKCVFFDWNHPGEA